MFGALVAGLAIGLRSQTFLLTLPLLAIALGTSSICRAATLIERNAAARLGLVRAWYAQVGAPRATGTIAHLSYDHGILLAQSTRGLITAIEAEGQANRKRAP